MSPAPALTKSSEQRLEVCRYYKLRTIPNASNYRECRPVARIVTAIRISFRRECCVASTFSVKGEEKIKCQNDALQVIWSITGAQPEAIDHVCIIKGLPPLLDRPDVSTVPWLSKSCPSVDCASVFCLCGDVSAILPARTIKPNFAVMTFWNIQKLVFRSERYVAAFTSGTL